MIKNGYNDLSKSNNLKLLFFHFEKLEKVVVNKLNETGDCHNLYSVNFLYMYAVSYFLGLQILKPNCWVIFIL